MPFIESHGMAADCGIQLLNPLEIDDWDERMRHFPSATIFHSAAWARTLHSTYGYTPLYLAKYEMGCLHSLLPLMEVNSWLTGRRGISLPFTDEVGPLCPDADSFRSLFEQAMSCAKLRTWKYWECRGGAVWFADAPASTSFHGHRLNLQDDEVALFARFKSSVRRAVRKAEQSNLTIEFSKEIKDVKIFHDLLAKTRQRHGMPVQPLSFFKNIHRHILCSNCGWVVLAWQDGEPIAGAMFFHFGKTAIYKFSASNESLQHLRANNLIIWHAIKWYAHYGFAILDFGRTSLGNEGLRNFKLGWGTQEHRIDYFKCDRRTGGFVTTPDVSSGWHSWIFKILPIFLSRLISRALYKHIA
jgi:Acetyltransferase (GNAT) domain